MISPSIPKIEDETEHMGMIRRGREWRQHLLQALTQRTRLTPRRRLHYTTCWLRSTGNQCTPSFAFFSSGFHLSITQNKRAACTHMVRPDGLYLHRDCATPSGAAIGHRVAHNSRWTDRVNKITEVGSIGGQVSGSIACSGGIYSPQRARLCPWKLTSLQPLLRFLDLSSEPVYGTRVACGSAERIVPVRNFPARVNLHPVTDGDIAGSTSGKTKPRAKEG
ncbi:hypothetical protein GE21DRAFT_250 [Neurospora crassa]|uniref:Uncharacterized protein n=1 Tax=Neurospora crassa (strain ATCC 24698 / 74-OR23-1A / CBS 708.71 / DSM 1257 / FGSC 987) TaxID=367110 RepID=Q7SEP6_NEUCR|nr:hypothetical protein NCU02171 [Neurospora crassa OR74A]EAA35294.3 hypothetical protein NCU02171 [Neurospora crassa OR74A]KHE83982.1 hypothetical protein GE21DRAFT_250 [Neurospora crassa]|eukprot:XP_964530.3 hypothetical protein NCU02171 [Neurospora crassa OR74A]